MVQFCGQDRCTVDANGRVKLSPRFLMDFGRDGGGVVLHCLPEGALGLYPAAHWTQMRAADADRGPAAGRNVVWRRQLRRFGALTQSDSISRQGRITIPQHFRDLVALQPGTEAVLVGAEIGVEIWNADRWQKEFEILLAHEQEKARLQMEADLADAKGGLDGTGTGHGSCVQ